MGLEILAPYGGPYPVTGPDGLKIRFSSLPALKELLESRRGGKLN